MACNTRCAGPDQELAAHFSRVDPGPTCGCHEVWRFMFKKPLPDGTYVATPA